MSLKSDITEAMKDAMRAKDAPRLLTIRGLMAAMKQREVDERITLDDAAIVGIIDKLVKQRKDSITQFTAGNRPDLVEKESAELAVLEGYLPQRLSTEAITAEVALIVAEPGASTNNPFIGMLAPNCEYAVPSPGCDTVNVCCPCKDRKSTRLNSSHRSLSRMPSSA